MSGTWVYSRTSGDCLGLRLHVLVAGALPWVRGTGLVETAPTSSPWLLSDARCCSSHVRKGGKERVKPALMAFHVAVCPQSSITAVSEAAASSLH